MVVERQGSLREPSHMSWIDDVRLEWFSSPKHWANVMAHAHRLRGLHGGAAARVAAAESARAAPERRSFFSDVEAELKRRTPPPTG
jgi:hypothetical protein